MSLFIEVVEALGRVARETSFAPIRKVIEHTQADHDFPCSYLPLSLSKLNAIGDGCFDETVDVLAEMLAIITHKEFPKVPQ